MVLLLQTWLAASGNILVTGIARRPCFGQKEQSEGEVTSTSWKVLFAKTFCAEAQEIVKQNMQIWFGKQFTFYLPLRNIFSVINKYLR
jgi:hypothetical protein